MTEKRPNRRKYPIAPGVMSHETECKLIKACSEVKDLNVRAISDQLGLDYNTAWVQIKRTVINLGGKAGISLYYNRQEVLEVMCVLYAKYKEGIDRVLQEKGASHR